jgi:hypothetical protein
MKNKLNKTSLPLPSWIDGYVFNVHQADLFFGQNRKTPVKNRPCISYRKRDGNMLMLPCTSKKSPTFFTLTTNDVMTKNKTNWKTGYVSPQYETIQDTAETHKYGILNHSTRINMASWLNAISGHTLGSQNNGE